MNIIFTVINKIIYTRKLEVNFLVICLFVFFVPIDMINGVLIRNGYLSISIIYKFIVLNVVLILLFLKGDRVASFSIVTLISIYVFIHSVLFKDVINAIKGIDMLVRFGAIIIFYLYFKYLINIGYKEYVFFVVSASFIFLFINIIFGALGYGYSMYGGGDNGIGTRGFIFAGNEIGAAVISSGSVLTMRTIENNKNIKFIFLGIVMLFIGAMMTSKVSILGAVLIILFFPLIKLMKSFNGTRIIKKSFYLAIMLMVVMFFLVIVSLYYSVYYSNLHDRLLYLYHNYDLVTFLFSNRNVWAIEAKDIFIEKYSLWEYIMGNGREWWYNISDKKIVEIDPIDFTMSYGLFGAIIYFGFILISLIKMVRLPKYNIYNIYSIFTVLLLTGMSFTAGHIYNSGTAGFLISIIFAIGVNKIEKD